MKRILAVVAAVLATAAITVPAMAQEFYRGKQIKIIVSSATGGGYDAVARLLQRFMPQYIPGNPSIIVVNMPGANGLLAANHFANLAEKDGTTLAVMNRFAAIMPLFGNDQAKFKTEDFQWIGTTASYSDNAYLLVIRSTLPYQTVDDIRRATAPLIIGTTGSDVPAILKEALGLNLKLITGYKGSEEMELAFERGEIDAHTTAYSSILQRHPDWFKTGFVRTMLQFARIDRLAPLKDVPTARELAQTPSDRALIEFAELPLLMARPLAAPAGVPVERVQLLRDAFAKVMANPDHKAESARLNLELAPKSGEEVQAIIAGMAKVDPAIVQRYIKALGGKLPSGN